ncbi:MAG: hypothetical protein M1511_03385, partial [Deltaproteobacteria bacterium]|nr:hypothetical protein [Deltaproteobacteria bacterium]
YLKPAKYFETFYFMIIWMSRTGMIAHIVDIEQPLEIDVRSKKNTSMVDDSLGGCRNIMCHVVELNLAFCFPFFLGAGTGS